MDEHYVNVMCGFFFETKTDCGNMVSTIFYETLKVEAATIAARYELVGTAQEVVCHLPVVDDQDFFMSISTNNIIVEVNLHSIEIGEEVEQEDFTKEHNKDVFNIVFEYIGIQSSMGKNLKTRFLINLMHI